MSRGNGSVAKQAIASGKLAAFVQKSGGTGENTVSREYVDWSVFDPSLIAGAVASVNKEGGSLLFGHTRDKSSYSIMVFYGGDKRPYYFPCTADGHKACVDFLWGLCDLTS